MPNLAEQQDVELSIAKRFHALCEKHHLRYVLAYGSLLGAIRHKGFIPWDNDMDAFMPREDYEKLLSLLKQGADIGGLGYLHYSTHPTYHYAILRLTDDTTCVEVPYINEYPENTGIWFDIFPMDGYTDPASFNGKLLKAWKLVQNNDLYPAKPNESSKKRLLRTLTNMLIPNTNNKHYAAINKLAMKTPYGTDGLCSDAVERPHGLRFPVAMIEERILVPFASPSDKTQLYVPKDWDTVLRISYGDSYLRMPPENERETHPINAWWKNEKNQA